MMAAAEAGRGVAYFTFNDTRLARDIHRMHALMTEKDLTVGKLSPENRNLHGCHRSKKCQGKLMFFSRLGGCLEILKIATTKKQQQKVHIFGQMSGKIEISGFKGNQNAAKLVIWVQICETELMADIYSKSLVKVIGKVLIMKSS